MSAHPDVDVIIATRDRPQLLRQSIAAVLASEYPGSVRVLVVYDQAEPDMSLETEQALGLGEHRRVTVMHNDRTPGLAGARNTGLLAADAELVAFCDDDDRWFVTKLARQVAHLRENPTAELVCCGIEVEYQDKNHRRTLESTSITLADLLRDRHTELHPSTFVMRRKAVVDGFGLVDEKIPGSYAEDYEFLLRAARSHPIANVPVVGVHVLWSDGSYFEARWGTWYSALTWLREVYPEFSTVPAGDAWLMGKIAFAAAADGRRREGAEWAWKAIRTRPAEPRSYLALAVASGIAKPQWIIRQLHRTGRGI